MGPYARVERDASECWSGEALSHAIALIGVPQGEVEGIVRALMDRGHEAKVLQDRPDEPPDLAEQSADLFVADLSTSSDLRVALDRWGQLIAATRVPVITLMPKGALSERLRALSLGAEDCLAKPFVIEELVARAEAILRRSDTNADRAPQVLADDWLLVNLDAKEVLADGREVQLSAREYELLAYLVLNAGRLLSTHQILSAVFDAERTKVKRSTLRQYVWRLRHKIEPDPSNPEYVVGYRGLGYRFRFQTPLRAVP